MGLSISNPTTTVTPNRLVTKSGSAGATSLSAQTTISVTAGVASYSSWVQVTASTASDSLLTGIWVYSTSPSASADAPLMVKIGTGGAGSETIVYETAFTVGAATEAAYMPITVPVRVAASARVAVSIYSATNATAHKVLVFAVPNANLEGN